jgi:hypothetical protein
MLGPRARLFAVGFLAVAIWPVSMSTLIKPYSLDLLAALALALPAVQWLRDPERSRGLVWLTILAPVALLASYPAAFVAGAVSLALLPKWRKSPGWLVAFNVMVAVGFLLASRVGANQLATPIAGVNTERGMTLYWKEGFPPATLAFPLWLLSALTGQMAAYPVGAASGGSAATAILTLIGAVLWARRGRWQWLCLALGPIALNFVAAAMHKYPFGASCRLSQHLAPGICVLAGMGLAAVIARLPLSGRWAIITAAAFALIGVGGVIRDVMRPYRGAADLWAQDVMAGVARDVPADAPVIVCHRPEGMEVVFTWLWAIRWSNIGWDFAVPECDGTRAWGFYHGSEQESHAACARVLGLLRERDPSWRLAGRTPHTHHELRCELFAFERGPTPAGGGVQVKAP